MSDNPWDDPGEDTRAPRMWVAAAIGIIVLVIAGFLALALVARG